MLIFYLRVIKILVKQILITKAKETQKRFHLRELSSRGRSAGTRKKLKETPQN